jgi:hypothetical protein
MYKWNTPWAGLFAPQSPIKGLPLLLTLRSNGLPLLLTLRTHSQRHAQSRKIQSTS